MFIVHQTSIFCFTKFSQQCRIVSHHFEQSLLNDLEIQKAHLLRCACLSLSRKPASSSCLGLCVPTNGPGFHSVTSRSVFIYTCLKQRKKKLLCILGDVISLDGSLGQQIWPVLGKGTDMVFMCVVCHCVSLLQTWLQTPVLLRINRSRRKSCCTSTVNH